jgi:hypothetical protein
MTPTMTQSKQAVSGGIRSSCGSELETQVQGNEMSSNFAFLQQPKVDQDSHFSRI